ncbi:MAG: tubulin-like doman-containing protein [Bacteroidales bacterium]|jgi:hypothetical protein|nr:tubulin-like doman-containing protein [Bacteroidales bacterium]
MKLFVFAVGGTGARVLRSLAPLLAAGCRLPENTTIVPIILDYDLNNGDTRRAENLLEKYQVVRREAYKQSAYKDDTFFATPIMRMDQIPVANGAQSRAGQHFHVSVEGSENTFGDYIGYNLLMHNTVSAKDLSLSNNLLRSLYNDDPQSPARELHLRLNVGFKGNPNIGSVVFDKWIDGNDFHFFEENVSEGDRIFVISSIFGGTGASGFPKIIQRIRNSQHNNAANAKIGAAIVMPYFKFGDDPQSAITASFFNSKTKAALNYYESCRLNECIDAIYYLSDEVKDASGQYNNKEGGNEQKNDAHIMELLAATAIVDFANKRSDVELAVRSAYEFGLKDELKPVLHISHFDELSKERYWDNLTKLTFMLRYYQEILPKASQKLSHVVRLDLSPANFRNNNFHRALNDFLDIYKEWLLELENNTMRKFKPYNLSSSLNEILADKPLTKKNWIGKMVPLNIDAAFFYEKMDRYYDKHQHDGLCNEELFLLVARKAMREALEYYDR